MRNKVSKVALVAILLVGVSALAAAQNFNPGASAPAPVLNQGWSYDEALAVNTPSVDSPYTFNYPFQTIFRVTDQFIPGDVYNVYDNDLLILTSTFNGAQAPLTPVGDPLGESGWENGAYSHGAVILPAGLNVIKVTDTIDWASFGYPSYYPAGFYDRIDAVPDGGVSALLLGGAVLGIVGLRRKIG